MVSTYVLDDGLLLRVQQALSIRGSFHKNILQVTKWHCERTQAMQKCIAKTGINRKE